MESDLQHRHLHLLDHQHNQQKRMNSGLTRYQSAPSSYFSSFFNRESIEDFLHRPTSPETERILDRFLSTSGGDSVNNDSSNVSAPKLVTKIDPQTQTMSQIGQQETSHTSVSPKFYQSQSQQRLPPNPRTGRSLGVDRLPPMKAGGENSNLIRHQSSPAGLFANMEIDIKNFLMRGVDYGTNARSNTEAAFHSSNRPPTSGQMNNPISEIRNKNMPPESPENVDNFSAGFPISPWDDTTMSGNISGVKRLRDEDRTLSGPDVRDVQNADAGNRPPLLAHHLSLPKTSSDMSALEKLLLFQDSVPCKIRAKRGFATHPRSIAERVRRTKISERMRKLQDLVPNMDKQTSTADMLDLAVEYIKDLQNQVKMLSDGCARCRCGYQQQQQ